MDQCLLSILLELFYGLHTIDLLNPRFCLVEAAGTIRNKSMDEDTSTDEDKPTDEDQSTDTASFTNIARINITVNVDDPPETHFSLDALMRFAELPLLRTLSICGMEATAPVRGKPGGQDSKLEKLIFRDSTVTPRFMIEFLRGFPRLKSLTWEGPGWAARHTLSRRTLSGSV